MAEEARADELRVIAEYHSAYNEIVQPDLIVYQSRYYVRRWKPLLGGNGDAIVMALRSLGYYNPKTGEKRDGIPIDLPELAKLCGISVPTIKREFGTKKDGNLTNPTLHKFVHKDKNYRRDKVTGQIWRKENIYVVMMDDPIHDDDLPRLQQILDERGKGGSARMAQNEPNGNPRMAQNEPGRTHSESNSIQNEPGAAQSESIPSQSEPTLTITSDHPSLPFDIPVTAALPGVVTASPSGRAWAELTEDQQRPFRDQAAAELHKYAVEAGAERWARIGPRQEEVRARHIYETAQRGLA